MSLGEKNRGSEQLEPLTCTASGQVLNCLIDDVEELLDIIFVNAGESDAQIGAADGDGADTVLVEHVQAQLFGIDIFQFEAHEVTGVEGIILPGRVIFAAVYNLLGLEGSPFHDFKFFLLPMAAQRNVTR